MARSDAADADKPKIKSRFFTNNGGDRPKIDVDRPASPREIPAHEVTVPRATPVEEAEKPKKTRLADRDIDELLNDLESLDILDDE